MERATVYPTRRLLPAQHATAVQRVEEMLAGSHDVEARDEVDSVYTIVLRQDAGQREVTSAHGMTILIMSLLT